MITVQGFLLGCFVVTSIYHFFLFIFYNENYPALYFSLITFSSSVLTIVKGTEWVYKGKVILLIFLIVPVFYVLFTKNMYPEVFQNKTSNKIDRVIYIYSALMSCLVLFMPMSLFGLQVQNIQKVHFPINIAIVIYLLVQLFRASKAKKSDAKILLLGFIILFATAVMIYVIPENMFTKNNPIGALGILSLYSVVLARRYSTAYHVCENLVEERTEELRSKNDKLTYLLNRDALTGAYSRRYIMERLEKVFEEDYRLSGELSLISLDLDYFKKVNDQHGHPMGDEVLRRVTDELLKQISDEHTLGRIGGEEFLILLPKTNIEEAYSIAEQLRKRVKNIEFVARSNVFNVTCSLGVVSRKETMASYDDMLISVDQTLYQAKQEGRDRVCV